MPFEDTLIYAEFNGFEQLQSMFRKQSTVQFIEVSLIPTSVSYDGLDNVMSSRISYLSHAGNLYNIALNHFFKQYIIKDSVINMVTENMKIDDLYDIFNNANLTEVDPELSMLIKDSKTEVQAFIQNSNRGQDILGNEIIALVKIIN